MPIPLIPQLILAFALIVLMVRRLLTVDADEV